MAWSTKRKATFSDDLDILLGDLCTEWGFCNQLSGSDLVQNGDEITAEAFARAVLIAEGMPADEGSTWLPHIRAKFIKRYGASISSTKYER